MDEGAFDVITLFSVFTHLAPHDYVAMLRVLRRHVAPDGRLLYSLFIDEPYAAGYGFQRTVGDVLARRLAEGGEEAEALRDAIARRVAEAMEAGGGPGGGAEGSEATVGHDATGEVPGFVDAVPERPLAVALYTRELAHELVEGTGWEVVEEHQPGEHIQHHVVCRPV